MDELSLDKSAITLDEKCSGAATGIENPDAPLEPTTPIHSGKHVIHDRDRRVVRTCLAAFTVLVVFIAIGLVREVKELLVDHRERLNRDEVEFERGERQMKLPLAVKGVSGECACDALDLFFRRCARTAEFQREDPTVEIAVKLFTNGTQPGDGGGPTKDRVMSNLPFFQPSRREETTVSEVVKVDIFAYEWMDNALNVVTPELASELLRELQEILQQAPIDTLIWLNIAAAIPPECARVNRVRSKICKPVGNFIELNQRFKNTFVCSSTCLIAPESRIEPQAHRCANKKEWDDVLIPDELMNFVCRCEVFSLADIDDRDDRPFTIEWTKRIDAFKATGPPPRRRAKDMPDVRRTIKRCRALPEKTFRSAVAERFD